MPMNCYSFLVNLMAARVCKVLFFFVFLSSQVQSQRCREKQLNITRYGRCSGGGYPCFNPCTREEIVGREECLAAGHCCYNEGNCYLKQLTNVEPVEKINLNALGGEFLRNASRQASSRTFPGGPPALTLEQIQVLNPRVTLCPKFPESCLFSFTSPRDIQPKLNIPYCQRIACRPDNPFLDVGAKQCLLLPGCAFDFELFLYRGLFDHAFLPGVPVCHLAIRNEFFQRVANEYIQETGAFWNPLLSECFLRRYQDEIFRERPGCVMLRVLEEVGHRAKQAGWKNISERECHLINGCWLKSNCYYPLSPTNIKVVSSHNEKIPTFNQVTYGKQSCLPFNKSLSNGDFLDAYHVCLSAGCFVDVNRTELMQHMYGVATTYVPPHLQPQYWAMVLLGQIRADNWKEVADKLISDSVNSPVRFLNKILPQNVLRESTIGEGTSILPVALAINVTHSSILNSFAGLGFYGQFGTFNFPRPKGRPKRPSLNSRNVDNPTNLNLPNIRSLLANNFLSNDIASRNMRGFSNGLGNQAMSPPTLRPLYYCPYQNLNLPNLPNLKGSFEGCCDMPFCYLPHASIKTARSEIATYKSEWSSWGPCSSSCAAGQQTRRRFYIGDLGSDPEEETQPCFRPPCPNFTQWTAFTACSATCRGGRRSRSRVCVGHGKCRGKTVEHVPCSTGRCPQIRAGRWSRCSVTCGVGVQQRTLQCINPGDFVCPVKLSEEQKCEAFCGRMMPVDSNCDMSTCLITTTTQCRMKDGSPGHCRQTRVTSATRRCYEGRCCDKRNPRSCNRGRGHGRG